jgi:hypothetical protein
MFQAEVIPRNIKLFLLISGLSLIGGYFYVSFLATGYRAFIYVHGGILFFAGMAIFLRNIKPFLIFTTLFALAFGFGRHVVYQKLEFESTLFSSGIRIDAVDVVLLMCYIHWILTLEKWKTKIPRMTLGGKTGGLFIIWIVYVFLASLMAGTNVPYSIYEIIVYLKGFLLYFYLINNINDENDLRIVIYALFSACLIQSLYLIFQYITKTNYTIQGDWISYVGPEGFRSRGFYGSPDAHAVFLTTMFPVFLLAMYLVRGSLKRFLVIVGVAVVILGILFTQVRIAVAALAVSVLIALFMSYRERWVSQGQIMLTLGAILSTVAASTPVFYARFRYAAYGEERWPLIETAYNMFKSHILFGIGANDYNFVVLKYVPAGLIGTWVYTVHNEYLLRLSETGIFGFLLYYAFIILVTINFYKSTVTRNPLVYMVSCGLFAALMASFVHRLVSMYHYQQIFMFQCAIYALSVICRSMTGSAPSDKSVTQPD